MEFADKMWLEDLYRMTNGPMTFVQFHFKACFVCDLYNWPGPGLGPVMMDARREAVLVVGKNLVILPPGRSVTVTAAIQQQVISSHTFHLNFTLCIYLATLHLHFMFIAAGNTDRYLFTDWQELEQLKDDKDKDMQHG